MKNNFSKKEISKEIKEFFQNIKLKSPNEINKIKKLAASKNIPLKDKRKLFCKKCLTPYSGKEKIRFKENRKIITCSNCKNVSRWKMKI